LSLLLSSHAERKYKRKYQLPLHWRFHAAALLFGFSPQPTALTCFPLAAVYYTTALLITLSSLKSALLCHLAFPTPWTFLLPMLQRLPLQPPPWFCVLCPFQAPQLPLVIFRTPLLPAMEMGGCSWQPPPSLFGHQVFHDPCLDLGAYCRAGGITATIIKVDRLPNHVLTAGLDLLKTPSLSSKGDALGTSFMGTYILAPAPPVPQGLVSHSPVRNFEGRSFSFLGSTHHGGSVRSACLLHPAPLSPPVVPSHSTWSVGPSSHPPDSWGEYRHLDPEPGEQISS
jgi:hypothetical protein